MENTFSCAVRNGEIIPLEQAVLHISVKEVFFNFSVYESIRIMGRTALFLEEHLERLFESARRLEIDHSFHKDFISRLVGELIGAEGVDEATFRIQLIGSNVPELFIFPQSLPKYAQKLYSSGAEAIIYEGERIVPEVKSNSLLLNYLAQREAEKQGKLEALLVTRDGELLEGTRSNLFLVRGSCLVTPGTGILRGVTRTYILEAAREAGMEISYENPLLADILGGNYDELFITSTSMGAMPIALLDNIAFSPPFLVSSALHSMIKQKEREYVKRNSAKLRENSL